MNAQRLRLSVTRIEHQWLATSRTLSDAPRHLGIAFLPEHVVDPMGRRYFGTAIMHGAPFFYLWPRIPMGAAFACPRLKDLPPSGTSI